ncbi:hypothetical protein VOLCADRAFT_88885 [Volvox carteri f. nagariensis]|uniref:Uncharacterized protein n=1 Tax=Volvox carteri f. nagariensis TaxID=3068 RepID=D8TQ77_VOLCA|nr:uncharacterized protein VOLCADRAFT_88885 [Volvox carteri f. nagariensis]EFJ50487.1 hypothetical protein VOLCADRAFT_88885 [Volvox carteri f. nagariensis]|eukprot:XP_002948612.1 hypothetical protein VOLCADRAFT_88885 [Volvox carteri f. nagariensis]
MSCGVNFRFTGVRCNSALRQYGQYMGLMDTNWLQPPVFYSVRVFIILPFHLNDRSYGLHAHPKTIYTTTIKRRIQLPSRWTPETSMLEQTLTKACSCSCEMREQYDDVQYRDVKDTRRSDFLQFCTAHERKAKSRRGKLQLPWKAELEMGWPCEGSHLKIAEVISTTTS